MASVKKNILAKINPFLQRLLAKTHKMEMELEWSGKHAAPTFFNHYHDLYYQWVTYSNYAWLERGIFNSFFIKQSANVLELCCGDGFNTKNFYSKKASAITAIDMDATAIAYANKYNNSSKIKYEVKNINHALPVGIYNNIIIDAAIEQFSGDEQLQLIDQVKKLLHPSGVFSGVSIQKKEGKSYLEHNKREFENAKELKDYLLTRFAFVEVLENSHEEKVHLYFVASDNAITLFTHS